MTLDPTGKIPRAGTTVMTYIPNPGEGAVEFVVSPKLQQLIDHKWLADVKGSVPLPQVKLLSQRGDGSGGPVPPGQETPIPANAHYRDPAILTIIAENDNRDTLAQSTMAFGQFGIPRKIPLRAGLFQSWDITLSFAKDGRQTEATATTTAAGVSASSAFAKGVEAGTSIQSSQSAQSKAAAANTPEAKSIAHNKAQADLWAAYNNCISAKSPDCQVPPSQ